MTRFIIFSSFALLLILAGCSAGKVAMKKGDKKFDKGEYDLAIDYYKKAANKNFQSAYANFYIGESYRVSNRIGEAAPYYKMAIEAGMDEPEARLWYGFALKANEQYEEARQQFALLADRGGDGPEIERARVEEANLNKLQKLREKESYYRVKPIQEINTEYAEYSPVFFNNILYFTTSRGEEKIYKATGTPFTDIYQVESKGAVVDLGTLKKVDGGVNDDKINEGSVTFTRDGRTMIFAKGNSGRRKGKADVNLFITRYRNGSWSTPQMLSISDPNAWDSSPAFSRDGRTLYFASNREGGFGGTDIYAATMDGRGRWGNVRNMGATINTAGNEMFPYVSDDGKLYFSSTGHPGFGGLDLFVATREGGKIEVQNLGTPLNSNADDFGLFLYDPTKGWFSSNRAGGAGDDDIYTFVNNDPDLKIVNYFLTGTTLTPKGEGDSTELLPFVKVRLIGENGDLLEETVSNREGLFQFRVYPEENYELIGEREEYFTSRFNFSTVGRSVRKDTLTRVVTNVTFDTTLILDRIVLEKAIVLDNIYYDLDKAEIRPDAAKELDKLVRTLEDNPEIKIELSSHTDSRAPDDYNMRLSQRRADSAVSYIVSKGIEPVRLVARGYGETKLIIPDAQTEEQHQINRRTEFKVIGIDKNLAKQEEEEEGSPDDKYFNEDNYFDQK